MSGTFTTINMPERKHLTLFQLVEQIFVTKNLGRDAHLLLATLTRLTNERNDKQDHLNGYFSVDQVLIEAFPVQLQA